MDVKCELLKEKTALCHAVGLNLRTLHLSLGVGSLSLTVSMKVKVPAEDNVLYKLYRLLDIMCVPSIHTRGIVMFLKRQIKAHISSTAAENWLLKLVYSAVTRLRQIKSHRE